MKLRILDNTLRFRLSMPEIERFVAGQAVTAQVRFPAGDPLTICLRSDTSLTSAGASFSDGQINVSVAAARAQALTAADAVTIDETVVSDDGIDLLVKIEKDFRCLMPRNEDESQLFAHPQET